MTVWFGLSLGTPRDWVFACRAWLFFVRAAGSVPSADAARRLLLLSQVLSCLRRDHEGRFLTRCVHGQRVAAALDQCRHCVDAPFQPWLAETKARSFPPFTAVQTADGFRAQRYLDQHWSSELGAASLRSVAAPTLSEWLHFELTDPVAEGKRLAARLPHQRWCCFGVCPAGYVDLLGYYQSCLGAAAAMERDLTQLVSGLASCDAAASSGITYTLRCELVCRACVVPTRPAGWRCSTRCFRGWCPQVLCHLRWCVSRWIR